MKYNIFGKCDVFPDCDLQDKTQYNWGMVLDKKFPGDIKWHITYEQSNLQVAVQCMLLSMPDCVNIVALNDLHRIHYIDPNQPRSLELIKTGLGASCFTDTPPMPQPEGSAMHWSDTTMQTVLKSLSLDNHVVDNEKFYSEKDEQWASSYKKRNYIAQSKWELFVAIVLICKHARATGHDIRILPKRFKDFDYSKMHKLNKIHMTDIDHAIDHNMIFWCEHNGNQLGTMEWPFNAIDSIVDSQLLPWLNKDI